MLDRLAEPDPGVDPDPLLGDPRGERRLDPLGEERPDLVDDVVVGGVALHGARAAPHVHQDQPALALGAEAREIGLGAQGRDVVDDRGPGVERRPGDLDLGGVDRDRDGPAPASAATTGARSRDLDLRRDDLRARPGGLAADIEDVRALCGERAAVGDRPPGVEKEPAVRERVRGHVDDPHDPRGQGSRPRARRASAQLGKTSRRVACSSRIVHSCATSVSRSSALLEPRARTATRTRTLPPRSRNSVGS